MCDSTDPLHAAFATRLERVRGALTSEEFDRLVQDVVTTAHRLDEIETRGLGRSTLSTHHTVDRARVE